MGRAAGSGGVSGKVLAWFGVWAWVRPKIKHGYESDSGLKRNLKAWKSF